MFIKDFITVLIIGGPFVIANFALGQVVRAEGASKVSMNGCRTPLGVGASEFENTVEEFENFTEQVLKIKNSGIVREFNGKQIYYLDGAAKPKKGVVVIFREGKIQSKMPSDIKSFNKLQ